MSNSVERELDKPCCDSQCTVWSAREPRMYKGYDIHDTILIKPRRGGFEVETDIEIPFAVDPLKGTAGARDMMMKNKVILTMALGPKTPAGVRGPWFHQHYSPNCLPSVAALHVHLAGTARTPSEAERLADALWDAVDADRLTRLLQ
jgi:hypothetical protein